ncbi:MAG TPA: TonB family protein [Pyrinomonadaceae bacterium]|nr:TonB family protein [Pyrinomonadaceae bacterium]
MPLNVNRVLLSAAVTILFSSAIIFAQSPQPAEPAGEPKPTNQPSSKTPAEVIRDRIANARAQLAVRNHTSAIFELENIRKETGDLAIHSVVNVMLMHGYLEQGNYRKAKEFLEAHFTDYKNKNEAASTLYPPIAGQVIKGARSQAERYRALGLQIADRNLPADALKDVEQMRSLLELVVEQAKETSKDETCAPLALPLLEEATSARSLYSRDEYDARRWRDEIADAREQLAAQRSTVMTAVAGTPSQPQSVELVPVQTVASNATAPKTAQAVQQPNAARTVPAKPAAVEPTKVAEASKQPASPPVAEASAASASGPIEVGSLVPFATNKPQPVYPAAARQVRAAGVVRVEVVIDEDGQVAAVQNTVGHTMLQAAARDAIMKWRFRPFKRDGQPVRATGFVNFNFSL